MVVEGDTPFPKFERWLEKEYPSVYKEEIYHRSEWPIGILFTAFGFFPWLLSNFTSGSIQVIGLGVTLLGIIILIIGFIRYRFQLERYSYHGLTRNAITAAIMSIDSQIVKPDEIESLAPHHGKTTITSYDRGMKRKELIKLVKSTAGLIEWPSDFVDEIKEDLEQMKKRFRPYSIIFLVILFVPLSVIYYLYASGGLMLSLILVVPLISFTLQGTYDYLRYVIDNMHILKDKWAQEILASDSVQLEETMLEIFNRLQSEFQYPLRFYLGREYPLLKYTGRTKTTVTLARLKEAVLYP